MERRRRIEKALVVGAVVAATLGASRPNAGVTVTGGTPEQQQMARWAVERFAAAGLALPSLEIQFHDGRGACRGRPGLYLDGVVTICRTKVRTDVWAARELLHEMAHGWLEAEVTGLIRDRFLRLRGLSTWNDPGADWEERGFEHGAEIIAWAVGDQGEGVLMPSIPDNGRDRLTPAYELLTGRPVPTLHPAAEWADPV